MDPHVLTHNGVVVVPEMISMSRIPIVETGSAVVLDVGFDGLFRASAL